MVLPVTGGDARIGPRWRTEVRKRRDLKRKSWVAGGFFLFWGGARRGSQMRNVAGASDTLPPAWFGRIRRGHHTELVRQKTVEEAVAVNCGNVPRR